MLLSFAAAESKIKFYDISRLVVGTTQFPTANVVFRSPCTTDILKTYRVAQKVKTTSFDWSYRNPLDSCRCNYSGIEWYGDWYTGRWWVGCYIWYSKEGTGRGRSPPRPFFAVPNVTAHPSTASVPIKVLLYDGPLICGRNVAIKGLKSPDWIFMISGDDR